MAAQELDVPSGGRFDALCALPPTEDNGVSIGYARRLPPKPNLA